MKKVISIKDAPGAIGPYSQGIDIGDLIFLSGQLGIDVKSGNLGSTIEEQTKFALNNIKTILQEYGLNFSNIVKTTIYMTNLADFSKVNEIYATYFNGDYPARTTVQVAGLPKSGLIEIEVIVQK
ncbi:MAG: Rid family detoxifying hydrolase [Rickettsiales bacterium]|jgi:2-iminobutanoate/2-iminopropanoate deaminase|nr:Rid family detoxifying hydrolase [Rickettsiales bacterium]